MSNDVAIPPILPRTTAPPAQVAPAKVSSAEAVPVASGQSAASQRPLLNPSLHLDLALNLVVLQFTDDKGDVTNSIPSAKQLKAYATHQPQPGKSTLTGT